MESSLAVAYNDLSGDVGFFLGHGRGAANGDTAWTREQQAAIDRCVKGGLRNFYHCGHDWSFLKPMATMTLPSAANTLDLPDDFGSSEGQLLVTASGNTSWWPLNFQGMGILYEKQAQYPDTTGKPVMVCEEPIKGTSARDGQRFQLRFWPKADQAYTVKFAYYINPDYLTGNKPYAYGGPQHAETLLESCLAVAEKLLDDAATVHAAEFDRRLMASITMDRRNKPQLLGYNRDLSDVRYERVRNEHWKNPVTFNGVEY